MPVLTPPLSPHAAAGKKKKLKKKDKEYDLALDPAIKLATNLNKS